MSPSHDSVLRSTRFTTYRLCAPLPRFGVPSSSSPATPRRQARSIGAYDSRLMHEPALGLLQLTEQNAKGSTRDRLRAQDGPASADRVAKLERPRSAS